MVLQNILHHIGPLRRRPSGVTPDLVAAQHLAGLEDRLYNHHPCAQLDIIQIDPELHPNHNRVLQAS